MEIWSREQETERFNLFAYCLEFIACRLVGLSVHFGSVHFGLVWFGWVGLVQILTSIKNFFNFPNFFHNYLIFNAFQI